MRPVVFFFTAAFGLAVGAASAGDGLTNMRDRLGAIGGTLSVESTPGQGTRVTGSVPFHPAGA